MSELQELQTQLAATQARHAAELAEIQDQITVIRNGQLDELLARGAELGFNLQVVGNNSSAKTSSKTTSNRKPLTCKKCREAGLSGAGHTARTHDKWLDTQEAEIKAKF